MITLKEVMHRMGEDGVHKIINPTIRDTLHEFEDHPDLSNLINTAIKVYTEQGLLSDRNKLNSVLYHLSQESANELATHLKVTHDQSNPWDSLQNLPPKYLSAILEFFGLEYHSIQEEPVKQIPSKSLIEPGYALFAHQEKAIGEIKEYFGNTCSRKRLLLHMPTGSGKTRTSMNVVCDLFRSVINRTNNEVVVWLADTEELCDQAAEEFEKAWKALGVGNVELYRFYGNHDHDVGEINSGFVVSGLPKLNARLSKNQSSILSLASKIKLIVFDEAHKVLAPTYEHIVDLIQNVGTSDLLGLSATPGRSTFEEEQNKKLAEFFDCKKIELKIDGYDSPIDYLQDNGYLAKVNYIDIPYKPEDIELTQGEISSISDRENIPDRVLKALENDTKRNVKLINAVLKEVEARSKIILFACSVSNAEVISTILAYKKVKVGIVTGQTPGESRGKIIQEYKQGKLDVLVNYGVLTTGFDAPITNVAVIGRPTTSLMLYSQMVGRASRGTKAGGNKECKVYTVVDDLPGFRNMSEAFEHWNAAWI